jgi:hypothetical protein
MAKKIKWITNVREASRAGPLESIEERFKTVSKLKGDISKYPLTKKDGISFNTDKEKSRDFAEVFTPLHIVDEMLNVLPDKGMTSSTNNLDLCAGQGQFTVRMLRKLYEASGRNLNIQEYLSEHHFFNELQLESCFKLLWVFGNKINLAIGDALQIGKMPENWRGVWLWMVSIDSWVNVTSYVQLLCSRYNIEEESLFVEAVNKLITYITKASKEYKVNLKQIVSTKAGRQVLSDLVNQVSGVEANWQENATPEWVVREMCRLIPDIKKLKKILSSVRIRLWKKPRQRPCMA